MINYVQKFDRVKIFLSVCSTQSHLVSLLLSSIQANFGCGYWLEEVAGTNSIVLIISKTESRK